MATMIKCVKQYSYSSDYIDELLLITKRYNSARNYFYSRFSGIKSIGKLKSHRKLIRDVLMREGSCEMFGLQSRQWKMALEDAIGNIKSNWSNSKNKIKVAISNNENLSKDDKHYMFYILKFDSILVDVLTSTKFTAPKGLAEIKVDDNRKAYLHKLICRYIRKYKSNISYSKRLMTIQLDADMYEYIQKKDGLYIEIMSLVPRKRLSFKLKDNHIYKGNISIIINKQDRSIAIHKGLKVEAKALNETSVNVVGIDKGYSTMLSCSNNKEYGCELGSILSKQTELLSEKNKKRNRLYALAKEYSKAENHEKASNILKNNLGYIKKDRQSQKFQGRLKSYVNMSINLFMLDAKAKEVIIEDLTFKSNYSNKGKAYNRKMTQWVKGYIDERLEYKLKYNSINIEKVNPAYTSQVCADCGAFVKRNNSIIMCPTCGEKDANINAAKNILNRKYDKEINLYTNFKKVKEILSKRTPAIQNFKVEKAVQLELQLT